MKLIVPKFSSLLVVIIRLFSIGYIAFCHASKSFDDKASSQESSSTLKYTDILECKSPQWIWSSDYDDPTRIRGPFENDDDDNNDGDDDLFPFLHSEGRLNEDENRRLPHSSAVYQFFGRSRVRGNPSDSVHFILLGPNVDHWNAVGKILALRGFNAMACERVEGKDSDDRDNDAPNLVLEIMDALKWNRAILVGCDGESLLAMETTMMLAPDRVAGLVLCGDLTEANRLASESRVDVLDSFLRRILGCPFIIVWDGDDSSPSAVAGSSVHAAVETNSESRCLILGGGSAPHRIKPEQFAWILTRFVEEKLELPEKQTLGRVNSEDLRRRARAGRTGNASPGFFRVPFGANSLVSPEGRLMLGRAIATSLFYITTMRVIIVQGSILRAGLIGFKSRYQTVDALTRNIFQAIAAFILNYGYIPRLLSFKETVQVDEDESVDETPVSPLKTKEEHSKEDSETGNAKFDDSEDEGTDTGGQGETSKTDEKSEDQESPPDDQEKPIFRPLKPFLDSVVT